MHREYTERCAAAGVHVLCEKPMAMTSEDCEAMTDACEAAGVKLMIAYRLHFHEPYLQAIDIVRRGDIGDPQYFSSIFSHEVRDDDIRMQADTGGGALYDLGIYQVNAVRSYLGEPIRVRGVQTKEQGVDVMTSAILEFDGGAVAQLICHQKSADTSELHVVGTKGMVSLNPAYDYSMGLGLCVKVGEEEDEHQFEKTDQFAPELVTFSRCVLDDDEPEPNGEEGLGDIRVIEAIVESAATGAPVDLPRWDRDRRPTLDQAMKKPAVKPPEPVNAPSPSR
jgi:predicted dehydrogenase